MAANPRALAKALVAANPTPSNLPVGGFGGAPATLPAGQLSPMVASYEAWTNGRSNGPGLPRDWSAFLAGSFGPLAPIQPISIDNPEPGMERPDPRRYQYQVGWNMPIGPPGSEGLKLATFPQLRTIADTYSVARACINLRKQELVGLEWDIIPTKAAEKKMRGHISDRQEWDSRRARMMRFFRKPDSNYFSFASWFSAQLEDVFAVDALSLYMHPSRMRGKGVMGSDLAAFELIDGTTIRPMIDVHGAKPTPPNPAYQQFIYGVPRVDLMTVMSGDDIKDMGEAKYRQYTGDQLMYLPYDARDWTPYGFAPVEKALVPILSGLNRQNWQLEYFSEGSIPGLFITNGDANATPQQNREFQDALNAMAGDPAWKHKIIVLPGGSQTMPQTPADLAGQFDEMIMGQVCMAFDVMPMELGITPGRSTSGHSGGAVNQMGKLSTEAQHRKANTPLLHRMMEIYDYIIQVVAHQDDMRFMFEGLGEIEDEATQINNLVNEVSHGLKSIDEARIIRGEQPWGLPITSDPVLVIATGLIPLKGLDPVTGQPPQPIMPAAPIGPGGAPAGPGGPPPAGGPSAGQPAAPKPAPQPTAPAAAATPAHAGATTAGPTSSNKQATDTGNDGDAPAHVNTFAALRELDLIGRRLTKGVSIAGWRREHIPADVFTTLTGPGAVADARQLLKGIDRAQRKTDAVTESTRAVSEGLRMLAGGLSNGRIAPATFVDRAVTTIRNGIRTAIGNGAGHARADGISKVAIPAGFEGRFQLYAGAIFKAYEQGYGLATYGGADDPDNIVVRWHAKPGACVLCGPRDGGLYTIGGLPGFPGDGGFGKSATICVGGPNCRCALSYEKLAPGEARPADDGGTPTPVQQQIAAAVSAASKALHGPDPETAFSRVLDNHADQLAELQRPYVTGLYQDVLAARNDQQAQDTVEATYTRAPDGGPGWLVPTAVVSALIAAELYTQAQSQQQAAPVTTTGTAPATKSAGPAVPAATITAQLSRNYPADALGWVGGARWIGPVHLPTDAVDVDSVNEWTASHQPGRVGHFAAELRTDPETVRPVIAVHEPGETNVKIVDGHHRYLAARQDGQPVTAYIGQVDSNNGPWDELHTHQIHQGNDPANKSAADIVAAGLVVYAADSGRVLMLQRHNTDDDPAGGFWEFPGGRLDGNETPPAAARREWAEETGLTVPAGKVTGSWQDKNGIYNGYVLTIPHETDLPILDGRQDGANPDDPDGDETEALAWWDPDQLKNNPAVRPEVLDNRKRMLRAVRDGNTITKSVTIDKCLTCGCDMPADDHGDHRHITMQDINDAAAAAGISPAQAWHNLREATPAAVTGGPPEIVKVDEGAAGDYKARHLIQWFNHGADGRIDWGGPGDYDACVRVASEHMKPGMVHGFCANRHHDALGEWPATHAAQLRGKKAYVADWTGLGEPDLVKVGPKGYIHGWIHVGPVDIGADFHHPTHGKGTITHLDEHGHVHVRFTGANGKPKYRQFQHIDHPTATGSGRRGVHGNDDFTRHMRAAAAASRRKDYAAAADRYRQAADATTHPKLRQDMLDRAARDAAKVVAPRHSAAESTRTRLAAAIAALPKTQDEWNSHIGAMLPEERLIDRRHREESANLAKAQAALDKANAKLDEEFKAKRTPRARRNRIREERTYDERSNLMSAQTSVDYMDRVKGQLDRGEELSYPGSEAVFANMLGSQFHPNLPRDKNGRALVPEAYQKHLEHIHSVGYGLLFDISDARDSDKELARIEAQRTAATTAEERIRLIKQAAERRGQITREVLASVRDMGGVEHADVTPLTDSNPGNALGGADGPARDDWKERLNTASGYFPKDWLTVSAAKPLRLRTADRAYHQRDLIAMPKPERDADRYDGAFRDSTDEVNVHEMGHRMEGLIPGLKAMEFALTRSRSTHRDADGNLEVEAAKTLRDLTGSTGYEPGEVALPDKWRNPYAGKTYAESASSSEVSNPAASNWEVFQVGLQDVYGQSSRRFGDAELSAFVLGILATLGR